MKRGAMPILLALGLAVLITSFPRMALFVEAAPKKKPIVVRYVTFLPENHPILKGSKLFVKEVNEACKGELILQFTGGPEAIPGREQAQAARTGVVDATITPANYYQALFPIGETLNVSMLTPEEERQRGYYDLLNKEYEKIGLYFLGRMVMTSGFSFYVKDPVEKPGDLKGRKLRSSQLYFPLMKKLGITPVPVPMPEVYAALQRGIAQGFGWPLVGVVKFGWSDYIKYCIDHQFYKSDTVFVMNLGKWNSIPPHLQETLKRVIGESDAKLLRLFQEIEKNERKKMLDAGMKFIKFSPDDAKWYVDTAYEVMWEKLIKKRSETAKIRPMVSK